MMKKRIVNIAPVQVPNFFLPVSNFIVNDSLNLSIDNTFYPNVPDSDDILDL